MSVSADLYQRHYLALVRLARQLVDDLDSAEDVVQDVFAATTGRQLPDDPLPYLRTAVVNRSRSALRRRAVARRFAGRAHHIDDATDAADADALAAERRTRVLAAVDALPRRQREVVVLRYYADLRVAEIADTLGINAAAVSSALARALAALGTLKEIDRD